MASFQSSTQSGYESISNVKLFLNLGHEGEQHESSRNILNEKTRLYLDTYSFINFLTDRNYFSLLNLMQYDYTLFIPYDIREIEDVKNMDDILRYHTLDFILEPKSVKNRIVKVNTRLRGRQITFDSNTIYSDSGKSKILSTKKTDRGFIYYIDRPLLYYK